MPTAAPTHAQQQHQTMQCMEIWGGNEPFDAAVFTMAEFVPPDFPIARVEIIPPAIDPLSPKNMPLADATARTPHFPGFTAADANPDMGDSAIVEAIGLGGFAMAAAPAVAVLPFVESMFNPKARSSVGAARIIGEAGTIADTIALEYDFNLVREEGTAP